jgi:hypothetical protein
VAHCLETCDASARGGHFVAVCRLVSAHAFEAFASTNVPSTDSLSRVRAICEAAVREYGVPPRIRTDNGAPFAGTGLLGLSKLSLGRMKLGIVRSSACTTRSCAAPRRESTLVTEPACASTLMPQSARAVSRLSFHRRHFDDGNMLIKNSARRLSKLKRRRFLHGSR